MSQQEQIDAICQEIQQVQELHDNVLNEHGEAYFWSRIECVGQITGLRKALCVLLGWPLSEAGKEGLADQYAQGWARMFHVKHQRRTDGRDL